MLKINVLIVENEELVAEDIKMQLEENDFDVCQIATRMDEVLRFVEVHKPDIILMDIDLDGPYDGIDVTIKIKEKNPDLPVIFLTEMNDERTRNRALPTGVKHFHPKPFNIKNTGWAIRAILSEQTDGKQNQDLNSLWLTENQAKYKVNKKDILYLHAQGAYCHLYFSKTDYKVVSKSMRVVKDSINDPGFMQIHRSIIVNTNAVTKYSDDHIWIGDISLKISRMFKENVKRRFNSI